MLSPHLVEYGHAEEELAKFEDKMLTSGYSMREISLIVREGRARYSSLLKKAEDYERPLYRHSNWHKEERALAKEMKKRRWYGESDEVVRIEEETGVLMNTKIEWLRPAGIRHTVKRM